MVVGNACCGCVLAGAVCMLVRSTKYSIRGSNAHEYVAMRNVGSCSLSEVSSVRGVVLSGAHLDLFDVDTPMLGLTLSLRDFLGPRQRLTVLLISVCCILGIR